MGEYNINSHIKKHIIKKILIIISALSIFAVSITSDIILFVEGNQLALELQQLYQANLSDVSGSGNHIEYNQYREKYNDLDATEVSDNLEKLAYLNYKQIRFVKSNIYVDIEHSSSETLQKSIDYLKKSGFSAKIESLHSEGDLDYVTMEVNQNG